MNDCLCHIRFTTPTAEYLKTSKFMVASSSKSASTVLIECTQKLASDYGVKPEQIMFISFNRV
ncbi:Uncharacterised protein [Enterobacter cloacae]|uniref:Uncharacterized protein n=1 Tax=Enterobacter cloacae TaxID=550 RepID=A0A377M4N4_ENTCL|nr:Uncharacterised protein [Enterobacter cloacae]